MVFFRNIILLKTEGLWATLQAVKTSQSMGADAQVCMCRCNCASEQVQGCASVGGPAWVRQHGCTSMGGPAWVRQHGCANMGAPAWVRLQRCTLGLVPCIWSVSLQIWTTLRIRDFGEGIFSSFQLQDPLKDTHDRLTLTCINKEGAMFLPLTSLCPPMTYVFVQRWTRGN